MSKELRVRLLTILGVVAAALFFTFPLEQRINLGLDLKGGMHLILKVETEKLDDNAKSDAVVRAIEILRNRIDGLGVSEPVIQRQGDDQIIVQLPGVTDRDAAMKMIGRVAQLTFHMVNDNPTKMQEAISGQVPEGYLLKNTKNDRRPVLIEAKPALKGDAISDARVDFDSSSLGQPKISFTLNNEGTKLFGDITSKHVDEQLAIVLDDEVISAPNINEPILTGSGEITGTFTFEEASLLALSLRSGALPAPMRVEEERTIGPLLGKDSITAGISASILGITLVVIFMAAYYLVAGLVADIALVLNLLLITGLMGFLKMTLPESQVTLTLPGIAGIILTLGMAVDANVLINERIREEIQIGRPLRTAIANGFNRAFSAIFDSNITTLIAAFMLFQFGSGPIKGFAVTLTIGLVSSLFTALFVSRTIFMMLLEFGWIKSLKMLQLFKDTKIDFISKRYIFYAISLALVIAGMTTFFRNQDKVYGIDFSGGQVQEYRFSKPVLGEELRNIISRGNIADVNIQQVKKTAEFDESWIIRTPGDTVSQVQELFKSQMPDNAYQVMRVENVGPIVGKHLRERALLAVIFALAGILLYVGTRFKHFDFATAGVVALLHDVVVTLGVIVMMGRQVDLLVVTALLTIAGFSINDTIVIYDRVRENLAKSRRFELKDIVNLSVNQTLSRTILTSLLTFLSVMALYLKGGEVLNTFALVMIIGFIAGSYSTIFIASPLVIACQKWFGSAPAGVPAGGRRSA